MSVKIDNGDHAAPSRATLDAARMKGADFDWRDAFRIDDLLTPEEVMIRDSARRFAQQQLMPRILEAHRHETFDVQ